MDRVYMTFVQAITGSGGWPMSVWLTPDLKPFFGGTYFPPESRWGRPGLRRRARGDRARLDATSVPRSRRRRTDWPSGCAGWGRASDGAAASPGPRRWPTAWRSSAEAFDAARGGFGGAPKFPRPSELLFLLRESRQNGRRRRPRHMVVHTLRAMAAGGMRDHLGGGFHRYSVDARLARAALREDAVRPGAARPRVSRGVPGRPATRRWRRWPGDTLDYVRRDMTSPEGGFYSAEDADSVPAGQRRCGRREGDGGRVLRLDRRRSRAACSAAMPLSSGTGSASSRAATRRRIRTASSPAGTCCMRRSRSIGSRA